MKQVYDTIFKLRGTSSLKAKELILKENDTPNLRKFLEAVYNPYKTYGIEKLPDSNPGELVWDENLWNYTELLRKRELTGNAAQSAIAGIFNTYTQDAIELFGCVLQKDLYAKCGIAIINKAIPELIPEFNVSLSHKFEEKRLPIVNGTFDIAVEVKCDGIRTIGITEDNKANFYSRNGIKFETMDNLKSQILATFGNDIMIDSEAISGGFQQSVSNIKRKGTNNSEINLWIFDILPRQEFLDGTCTKSFAERRKVLEECFARTPAELRPNLILIPQWQAKSMDELLSIYGKHLDDGFEGSMIKIKTDMYKYTRNFSVMKLKPTETLDVKIEGVIEAEGEQKGMVGKIISHSEEGVLITAGAGKMTHEVRTQMFQNPEAYIGRIVEIGYQNKTDAGMLRFPRFLKFRDTVKSPGDKE